MNNEKAVPNFIKILHSRLPISANIVFDSIMYMYVLCLGFLYNIPIQKIFFIYKIGDYISYCR